MKFLKKHQKIAILLLTLILAIEIEICYANINKFDRYHSRLRVNTFLIFLGKTENK
jgi:hypothetical protein